MKFWYLPAVLAAAVALGLTPSKGSGQAASPPSQTTPGKPQDPPPNPQQSSPKSQVIFSRSTDENGDTTTQTGPGQTPQMIAAPAANDAERQAVTFTSFDLDVHLRPDSHQIAVRASMSVRNDSKIPLTRIPLQL